MTRELIYEEFEEQFSGNNFLYDENEYGYFFNTGNSLTTNHFDGISLNFNIPVKFPEPNLEKSGWINGNSPINIVIPDKEYRYFPFDFKIVL